MADWEVEFDDELDVEHQAWPEEAQNELLAKLQLLEKYGPNLKRPHADTLKGSKHKNMKELRFDAAGGVWRVAFAFDPERKAILLVGGDKSGGSEKRFYKTLITRADGRFDAHLATLKSRRGER